MPQPPPPATPKKRVRLAPALRKQLILDAALAEFGAHGFGATSTETIARRAGLSQAGLYAHFASKEAILASLFDEILAPEWNQWLAEDEPFTEQRIDRLVDHWYDKVADARVLAVFRLLVAEGSRLADAVRHWRETAVIPYFAEQQRIVDTLVARGHMQDNALAGCFQLASSPLVHVLLMHLLGAGAGGAAGDGARPAIAALREAHRAMLKQFLAPPAGGERAAAGRARARRTQRRAGPD